MARVTQLGYLGLVVLGNPFAWRQNSTLDVIFSFSLWSQYDTPIRSQVKTLAHTLAEDSAPLGATHRRGVTIGYYVLY
jgi:hypothetical protein